jgi:hypothetical protein
MGNVISKYGASTIIIGITLAVLVIAFAIYHNKSWPNTRKFIGYFTIMNAFTLASSMLIIINQQKASQVNEEYKYVTTHTVEQERAFIDTGTIFMQEYPYSFRLYQEMNSNDAIISSLPAPNVDDETKRVIIETVLAKNVIQRIENTYNILTSEHVDWSKPENIEWINTWRIWFRSKRLNEIWQRNKVLYNSIFAQFLDREIIANTHTLLWESCSACQQ